MHRRWAKRLQRVTSVRPPNATPMCSSTRTPPRARKKKNGAASNETPVQQTATVTSVSVRTTPTNCGTLPPGTYEPVTERTCSRTPNKYYIPWVPRRRTCRVPGQYSHMVGAQRKENCKNKPSPHYRARTTPRIINIHKL